MSIPRMCQWFVMCGNEATHTRHHPILGDVPICDRCDAKTDAIEAAVERTTKPEDIYGPVDLKKLTNDQLREAVENVNLRRIRLHYTDRIAEPWLDIAEMAALPRTVVYDGTVLVEDGDDLAIAEACFSQFNRVGGGHYEHPALDGNKLRSFSTGDVVEIVGDDGSQFMLCLSAGFEKIDAVS